MGKILTKIPARENRRSASSFSAGPCQDNCRTGGTPQLASRSSQVNPLLERRVCKRRGTRAFAMCVCVCGTFDQDAGGGVAAAPNDDRCLLRKSVSAPEIQIWLNAWHQISPKTLARHAKRQNRGWGSGSRFLHSPPSARYKLMLPIALSEFAPDECRVHAGYCPQAAPHIVLASP